MCYISCTYVDVRGQANPAQQHGHPPRDDALGRKQQSRLTAKGVRSLAEHSHLNKLFCYSGSFTVGCCTYMYTVQTKPMKSLFRVPKQQRQRRRPPQESPQPFLHSSSGCQKRRETDHHLSPFLNTHHKLGTARLIPWCSTHRMQYNKFYISHTTYLVVQPHVRKRKKQNAQRRHSLSCCTAVHQVYVYRDGRLALPGVSLE